AGGNQTCAVVGERHGGNRPTMAAEPLAASPFIRGGIESPESAVAAIVAGRNDTAAGSEGDRGDFSSMPFERRQAVAAVSVPDDSRSFGAASGNQFVVVAHGEGGGAAGVVEPQVLGPGGDVPQPHGAVAGPGGEPRTIAKENGGTGEEVVTFGEMLYAIERRGVPDRGGPIAAGGDDQLAVRRESR